MSSSEQSLGALLAQRDPRGPFALDAQYETISQVIPQLHGHNAILWSLSGEDQEDSGSSSFDSKPLNNI